MSSGDSDEYTFRCPECEERLAVDAEMMTVLVEKGCVICGASVTADAFTPCADTS